MQPILSQSRHTATRRLVARATWVVQRLQIRRAGTRHRAYTFTKRCIDVVGSAAILLLVSPLLLACAIAIKLEDGGSVFFAQTRAGRRGKPFLFYKLRSMSSDAEKRRAALLSSRDSLDRSRFKLKHDPRITRTGAIIRRFSIDELPQLWNVFKGDMSLVGPRPPLPEEVREYGRRAHIRLMGQPGLTCTWQVGGRADIPFEKQLEMDIDYLCSQSLLLDLKLLAKTVPAVLLGRGAY